MAPLLLLSALLVAAQHATASWCNGPMTDVAGLAGCTEVGGDVSLLLQGGDEVNLNDLRIVHGDLTLTIRKDGVRHLRLPYLQSVHGNLKVASVNQGQAQSISIATDTAANPLTVGGNIVFDLDKASFTAVDIQHVRSASNVYITAYNNAELGTISIGDSDDVIPFVLGGTASIVLKDQSSATDIDVRSLSKLGSVALEFVNRVSAENVRFSGIDFPIFGDVVVEASSQVQMPNVQLVGAVAIGGRLHNQVDNQAHVAVQVTSGAEVCVGGGITATQRDGATAPITFNQPQNGRVCIASANTGLPTITANGAELLFEGDDNENCPLASFSNCVCRGEGAHCGEYVNPCVEPGTVQNLAVIEHCVIIYGDVILDSGILNPANGAIQLPVLQEVTGSLTVQTSGWVGLNQVKFASLEFVHDDLVVSAAVGGVSNVEAHSLRSVGRDLKLRTPGSDINVITLGNPSGNNPFTVSGQIGIKTYNHAFNVIIFNNLRQIGAPGDSFPAAEVEASFQTGKIAWLKFYGNEDGLMLHGNVNVKIAGEKLDNIKFTNLQCGDNDIVITTENGASYPLLVEVNGVAVTATTIQGNNLPDGSCLVTEDMYEWRTEDPGPCETLCGLEEQEVVGSVECVELETNQVVPESNCDEDDKPDAPTVTCEATSPCQWVTEDWGDCVGEDTCGTGTQTRVVGCGGASCNEDNKPDTTRECNLGPCRWVVGEWGDCEGDFTCGLGTSTRTVECTGNSEASCEDDKPDTTRECSLGPCRWVVTPPECPALCSQEDQEVEGEVHCAGGEGACPAGNKPDTPTATCPACAWHAAAAECPDQCTPELGVVEGDVSCINPATQATVDDERCAGDAPPADTTDCTCVFTATLTQDLAYEEVVEAAGSSVNCQTAAGQLAQEFCSFVQDAIETVMTNPLTQWDDILDINLSPGSVVTVVRCYDENLCDSISGLSLNPCDLPVIECPNEVDKNIVTTAAPSSSGASSTAPIAAVAAVAVLLLLLLLLARRRRRREPEMRMPSNEAGAVFANNTVTSFANSDVFQVKPPFCGEAIYQEPWDGSLGPRFSQRRSRTSIDDFYTFANSADMEYDLGEAGPDGPLYDQGDGYMSMDATYEEASSLETGNRTLYDMASDGSGGNRKGGALADPTYDMPSTDAYGGHHLEVTYDTADNSGLERRPQQQPTYDMGSSGKGLAGTNQATYDLGSSGSANKNQPIYDMGEGDAEVKGKQGVGSSTQNQPTYDLGSSASANKNQPLYDMGEGVGGGSQHQPTYDLGTSGGSNRNQPLYDMGAAAAAAGVIKTTSRGASALQQQQPAYDLGSAGAAALGQPTYDLANTSGYANMPPHQNQAGQPTYDLGANSAKSQRKGKAAPAAAASSSSYNNALGQPRQQQQPKSGVKPQTYDMGEGDEIYDNCVAQEAPSDDEGAPEEYGFSDEEGKANTQQATYDLGNSAAAAASPAPLYDQGNATEPSLYDNARQ